MKRILFVVPYPLHKAPSQRFRVELYEPVLNEAGVEYHIAPFMDENTWNIIYKKGSLIKKTIGIVISYFKRLLLLLSVAKYHYIFIHRESMPLGPPIFEWICAKLLRKKIIYDFDDAIWIPNTSAENKLAGWFKAFWKVKYICKWAYKIAAGNDFLCEYARKYNDNVVLLPTCVDTQNGHGKTKEYVDNKKPIVGWTGSHSTLFYLDEITPIIAELQKEMEFDFWVIADKKPELELLNWTFIKWNETTEQDDLLNIDIGIMPLKRDAWSEGKCGFKLIQYLASGIPAIADPIGVNSIIIEDGVNGFLCDNKEEWKEKLKLLLTDPSMRKSFGKNGRMRIEENYSVQSQKETFLSLFN